MEDMERQNINKVYIETLHQCYSFGFEYHKEVMRLVSGDARISLSKDVVGFAKSWMKFCINKCERGKGLRPRYVMIKKGKFSDHLGP